MSHLSYEESKKRVFFGLKLLAVITLIEVVVSLFGKGFLGDGSPKTGVVKGIVIILLIAFSLYKARFIIFEFMHLGYEVKSLSWAILFPIGLLVWAMYPFFQDGNAWKNRRKNDGDSTNKEQIIKKHKQEGSLLKDTYIIDDRG